MPIASAANVGHGVVVVVDVVVVDVESAGWNASEARMFESRLILMDFRKRLDSDGVRLWVRRPGS